MYSRICKSSCKVSAKSFSAYQRASQSLMTPIRIPIGLIFCPINYASSAVFTTTVMWLVRLLILEAELFARGRQRFFVGPSFTNASITTMLAGSNPLLCSAFAIADINTFSTAGDDERGVFFKIAIASPTVLLRIKSTTKRALRAETQTVFAVAFADVICSAILYFLLSD